MLGSMRILVSTPAICLANVVDLPVIKNLFVDDPVEFESAEQTLDSFKSGLEGVKPKNMWGLNVPNFPLELNGAKGVAGPGKPQEELFYPPELKRKLQPLCGKYDKWRPYPADKPLSEYAMKMAKRFTNKRCRMFDFASRKLSWDLLFYVEHSQASLAHLDSDLAVEIAEKVFEQLARTCSEWPSVPVVLFSPYGTKGRPGFVVSKNIVGPMNNWEHIRSYVNRTRSAD